MRKTITDDLKVFDAHIQHKMTLFLIRFVSVDSDFSSSYIVLACQSKVLSCYKHSSHQCLLFDIQKNPPSMLCIKSSSVQTSDLQPKIQICSRNCTKLHSYLQKGQCNVLTHTANMCTMLYSQTDCKVNRLH